MVLWRTFDLVLSYLLCAYVESICGVKVVDNGYRDIVIAIKPSISYNDMIPEKIKEMMVEASSFLYRATKKRLYFSDVKILLPSTWSVNSSLVQRPTTQSCEKANVIIAELHALHGDTSYTLQYGGCGEKGRYIHLTPNFILNDSLVPVYGKKGRSFVHGWAHLQWGVFNEYDDQVPFYRSDDGSIEATRVADGNCKFYPDEKQTASFSIMYHPGLENVVEFCGDKMHNTEAPNMQNRMYNYRSTWDVIARSEDFRNISSRHTGSVIPTFTLLQAKDHVVCLVLDVSGGMQMENRIVRLRQAAEIFLLQVVEPRSQVGIVTFNSGARIQAQLKKIDDQTRKGLVHLLPISAGGGTNICAGLRSGFQVLRGDDGATRGDEITLLTDGEDNKISDCFSEVEQSGAIIHTIALGPSAAKELEQLSAMTGGLQFAATDKVDTNGLIDAFTGLVSGSGDISQQSIQLESSGRSVDGGSCFSGTVAINKTVGNNTHFVLTWDELTPIVFVRDPSGKMYSISDFDVDEIVHTAWLEINGFAQSGTWTYSIMNPGNTQKVTITVTSRAADEEVPPVTVNTKISGKDSTSPVTIYVEVSQGFLPVLFAQVTVIAELPNGQTDDQELLDNGLGADVIENDGVYSKYFLNTAEHGRYNFKVRVEGKEGSAKMAHRTDGGAMYIPGYTVNGIIHTNLPRPPVSDEDPVAQIGDFSRIVSGGALSIPAGTPVVNFPPCRVTDLQATILNDEIELQWTAPGAELDQGTASYYEMRMSDKLLQLRDSFSRAELGNLTSLIPRPFGSKETFTIVAENAGLRNRTTLYFALRAYDEKDQSSEMSNVAGISVFVPLPKESKGSHVLHSIWIAVVVAVIVRLIVGITYHVVKKKCKSKRLPEAVAVYRQVASI